MVKNDNKRVKNDKKMVIFPYLFLKQKKDTQYMAGNNSRFVGY